MHVFWPWQEAREPGEKPHRHGENLQTPHTKGRRPGIDPRAFLQWGGSTNYHTNVLPSLQKPKSLVIFFFWGNSETKKILNAAFNLPQLHPLWCLHLQYLRSVTFIVIPIWWQSTLHLHECILLILSIFPDETSKSAQEVNGWKFLVKKNNRKHKMAFMPNLNVCIGMINW